MAESEPLKALQIRVEQARAAYPELTALSEIPTPDLVPLIRASGQAEAYAAELAIRHIEATSKLERALRDTSDRLYWLTFVLTAYTIVLVLFAAAVYLKG